MISSRSAKLHRIGVMPPRSRAIPAHVEHVAGDPVELAGEDPDVLRPSRHLQVEELLEGEHRAPLVEERADVLEGVHLADDLVVVGVLAQLLDAAMEVAQDRVEVDDLLAVDLEDDAQHAVGGGVLGSHVEEQLAVLEGVELLLALGPGDRDRVEDARVVDRDGERRVVEAGPGRCRHLDLAYTPGDVRRRVVSSASFGAPARSIGADPAAGRSRGVVGEVEVLAEREAHEVVAAGRSGAGRGCPRR